MNDNTLMTPDDARVLDSGLVALRDTKAPASLRPTVLVRVGLADSYFPVSTPIGQVFVAHNTHGISAVTMMDDADSFEQFFGERFGRPAYPVADGPASLHQAVMEHLRGKRHDLRFDLRGVSEFEQAVLLKALEIPRGEVRPYAWVAREIGRPRAVRAVGSALAHNPIPLLIPCHRVVKSGGDLGQYGLGPANKRVMLEAEGMSTDELERLPRSGVRYFGSGSTKIYCFPTCRHARRVMPKHLRTFHSEEEANAAGFRPCKVCRPLAMAQGA